LYATAPAACSAWLNVMAGIERFDFRRESNLSMIASNKHRPAWEL
jgi:hypothetical protein